MGSLPVSPLYYVGVLRGADCLPTLLCMCQSTSESNISDPQIVETIQTMPELQSECPDGRCQCGHVPQLQTETFPQLIRQ